MKSPSEDHGLNWELVESQDDRSYALFSVAIHRSKSPRTGRIHEFQVLHSPPWVSIMPVTPDGRLVMVNQFRHGSGELSLEPPGGLVKDGQLPEQSAWEELEEETGYKGESLELLGWMYPMPALFTNRFYVYLARDVLPTGRRHPDETEEVETVLVPLEEIREYIRSGRITCGVMIAALYLLLDRMDS